MARLLTLFVSICIGLPCASALAAEESNPIGDWYAKIYGKPAEPAAPAAADTRTVTPAAWPFALHLPAAGELLVRAADGTAPPELGQDDVQWFKPDNKPGDGLVYGINGAYVEKPEIYLGAGTQGERLAAHMAARYKELGKDMVGKPVTVSAGGRTWTRFQITDKVKGADGELVKDDNGNTVSFDYLSYVTPMPTGFINVVFLFDYPPSLDTDIEAWAAKVLGG